MLKKKLIKSLLFLLVLSILVPTFFCAFADDIQQEKQYKPLDLVVVVDSSGSMLFSDKERTALDAVRMLVNMMPAEDSRVAIISFNEYPTVLTQNEQKKPSLIGLEDFSGLETIRTAVSSINYKGGTGIGNAVYAATELLNTESNGDREKAIILFTDGVNDFDNNDLALSKCNDNEATAIQWAKNNDCRIYCVGYDYTTSDGSSSMGTNGEGLIKLENLSQNTSGKFKAINSISEIEQLLIEFLADVCDLNYKTVATIPGDGGYHECEIDVSPSVVEANIRIAGGKNDSISNGKVHLYDPSGTEISLSNSGNVRYDKDATAASIKIIMPKSGTWLLTVEGIEGEDIHVGLLEHFKMNLSSILVFPEGNPDGVAYTNDSIGIKTRLTYDGTDITEDGIYDSVKSATAVLVSRANPDDEKTIELTREGYSFVGNFTILEDSYYDITIRLDWDTVYREDTLTVASSNKPVELVKNIETADVNKNKTIEINDIYQYVKDDENDAIEASVLNVSEPDAADISIKDDVIEITGKKWTSTLVTIQYKDAQGNAVETSFKVKVHDPLAVAGIISTIALIVLFVVLLAVSAFRARIHLFGKARICIVADGEIDAAGYFRQDSNGFCYINQNGSNELSKSNIKQNINPIIVEKGNTNPASTPTQSGVFGSTQNSSSSLGGLFGNTHSNQSTTATPQTNSGVFGSTQNASLDKNGVFGNSQNSNAQFANVFGNSQTSIEPEESIFGGTKVNSELEAINRFNGAYDFGGKRIKKTTVEAILEGYYGDLYDYLKRQLPGEQFTVAQELEKRLSSVRVATSKMYLIGTIGGKSGATLKIDKKILKKQGITMNNPHLAKNKAELPYYQKGIVLLDFNVITDNKSDVKKGIRVSVELERS